MGFRSYDEETAITKEEDLLPRHGKYYRLDSDCEDVMLVPRDQRDILITCDLVTDHEIVLQVRKDFESL